MAQPAKEVKKFQSKLRAKMRITNAESLAKQLLEADGGDFKFQVIVGFYIVDFILPKRMLAIEIDGGYHDSNYQKWYDRQRDIFLTKAGFTVLRLKNEEADQLLKYLPEYPEINNWEKQFRSALGKANSMKSVLLRKQRKQAAQIKLI